MSNTAALCHIQYFTFLFTSRELTGSVVVPETYREIQGSCLNHTHGDLTLTIFKRSQA